MPELFNVYFRAEIDPAVQVDTVRQRLAALFKADTATVDRLFSGQPQLIRRHCSAEEAERYRSAMQRVGAVAHIQPVPAEGSPPAVAPADGGAPSAPSPPQDTAATATRFSLAEPGALLGPGRAAAPPAPDTDHLSLAPAGEPIPVLGQPSPPAPPDTSALQLAPPGADVLEARYRHRDRPASNRTSEASTA